MNNQIFTSENLIQYLDKELPKEMEQLLQHELQSNTDLQIELNNLIVTRKMVKGMALTAKVKAIHQEVMQERKQSATNRKKPAVVRTMMRHVLRVAASVLLIFGIFAGYQYFSLSNDKLYNENFESYKTTIRRGADSANSLEKLYTNKKYNDLIDVFNKITAPTIKEQFLLGQSYVALQNTQEAILLFKQVLERNRIAGTGIVQDDAEYYLAMAYLKNNELNMSIPLFEKIHQQKDHLYHDKVSSWFVKKLKILLWKN